MTTEEILAFSTPVAIIVAAIIQQLNAMKAKRDRHEVKDRVAEVAVKVSEDSVKLKDIGVKADQIHTLADGNLTKVTAALATANEKILGLEKLLIEMSHKKANGGEEP